MKLQLIFFVLGIIFTLLNYFKLFKVSIWYILGCFLISFILFYIQIHRKNKDINTPRPVYLTN